MDSTVEGMMVQVRNEDADGIKKTLMNKDPSLIKHELAIVSLMEGVLEADIILPRLVVCGVRTISLLHYSALRGADSVFAVLLAKVSVQQALSNGSTCLHFACFSGAVTTVKMLLDDYKADINKTDSYGWPALHYASIGGQLMVVEELCLRGINLMHRDQDGTTAAYRAKIFGHQAIVNLFNKLSNNNPCLLEPKEKNGKEEKIYSQPKLKGQSDDVVSVPGNDADRRFIDENNYDNPDDLITRIQCKYSPSVNDNNNGNSTNNDNGNSNSNNNPDYQILVGENIYDLPSEPKTSTSSDDSSKDKNVRKIQALVESQFKDIFLDHEDEPYLQPISGSNSLYGTVGPASMQDIGFKTLKFLLRSEFQKLKASYNSIPNNTTSNTSTTSTASTTPNVSSLFDEHNIYEEITKGTVKENESKWVKGGQTIRLGRNQRPPLPPRTSIIARPQSNLSLNEDNKDLRNSFNTDFGQASHKLNLIEETQFVKEACFNELIYVLGPGDWQKLARNLPLRNNKNLVEEKIRKIEKQFPKNMRKQARTALNDWNQYHGKNASLQKLVEALKKSGLVEKIKAVEMASQREFNA